MMQNFSYFLRQRHWWKSGWLIGGLMLSGPPSLPQLLASGEAPVVSTASAKQTLRSLESVLIDLEAAYRVSIVFDHALVENKQVEAELLLTDDLEASLRQLLGPFGLASRKIKKGVYVIKAPTKRRKKVDKLKQGPASTSLAFPDGQRPLPSRLPVATQTVVEKIITGQVTDLENGESLPGVNVVVKGTTIGTVTDVDGNYRLTAPDDAQTLVFSSVGYVSEEIAIGNQTVINLALSPDIQSLSEVVVVGYGTQQRSDVSGSIASVSSENIKDLTVSRADQALAGQVAGVQVSQSSGVPGRGTQVNIRGVGSITAGSDPLYVVDGFPIAGDLSTINPNDIASMDVLKDASAAAIYGSRGANGVVIITTKRSNKGGVQFNLDVYRGVQEVQRTVDVLDGDQFREYAVRARNNSYVQQGGNVDNPDNLRPGALRIADIQATTANTDWQDEIFRTAPIQNYQLSALGGNESVKYLISGNYFNQDGIIINSGFERYSIRANVDLKLSERVRGGISLSPTYSEFNEVDDGGRGGVITNSVALPAIFPVRNPDGSYGSSLGFGNGVSGITNPVAMAELIQNNSKSNRLLSNVFAEFDLLEDLTFRTSLGTDLQTNRNDYFEPDVISEGRNQTFGQSFTNLRFNWLFDNTLTYQKTLGGKHDLTLLLGYSAQEETTNSTFLQGTDFANNNVTTLSNATEVTFFNTREETWSLLSYFGRVNYSFADKYLFTATVRRDGSSRFGANNQWGIFPSVSGAWRLSEEPFIQNLEFLSDLKLRASWGKAGNFNIPNFGSLGLMEPNNYVFGGQRAIGLQPRTLGNQDLTWEISAQTDIGLDVGLFDGRVYLVADYFVKNTEDLLLNVQVPTTTGFSNYLQNLGEVKNWGWEFALTSRNVVQNNFSWKTSLNFTFVKNEVLALGPEGDPILSGAGSVSNTHITRIGEPLGNFFGYQRNEIYDNQEEIDANPVEDFSNRQPGDWKTEDTDGNLIIDADDRTIIGSPWPDFTYGITNTFNFNNFDLSVLIVGSEGNEILHLTKTLYGNFASNNNILAEQFNGWQSPTNIGNGLPRAARLPSSNQTAVSSYHVEDGSYLSVRNITLGYAINNNQMGNFPLESARIYFGIQNAFLFTDFLGFNPEESRDEGSALSPGASYGRYPLARTYTLGINLKF